MYATIDEDQFVDRMKAEYVYHEDEHTLYPRYSDEALRVIYRDLMKKDPTWTFDFFDVVEVYREIEDLQMFNEIFNTEFSCFAEVLEKLQKTLPVLVDNELTGVVTYI